MIERDKYYSIKKIFEMKVFGWITSYDTLRRWVTLDSLQENSMFKSIRKGNASGTRYYIKGETLLELVEEFKNGVQI